MPRFKHMVFVTMILSVVLISIYACGVYGTRIELTSYSPGLKGDLSDYRGKKIYLMNFDNQAMNTSIWYYYSRDYKFTYGWESLIHNYFWYSFRKAMVNLGMEVSNVDRPDPSAPGMWLRLKSLTDERFVVEVYIQKFSAPLFIKTYSINAEPLPPEERTPENLEMRAYDMTDKLIGAILTDPQFKSAFLKAEAEMSQWR